MRVDDALGVMFLHFLLLGGLKAADSNGRARARALCRDIAVALHAEGGLATGAPAIAFDA